MRTEQTPRARRYGAALFFVVMGTLLGAWHNRTTGQGRSDIVAGTVRAVISPPSGALGRASRWLRNETGALFHGDSADTAELRVRITQLEGENARLRDAQSRYDTLRADLGFVHRETTPKIAADVVARRPDPKFDTCLLNQGSGAGVRHNSVVVTRSGLVGQISEITPTTASVLLLNDQNCRVGAKLQRSNVEGICQGQNGALLSMFNIPNEADVKPGDIVTTSGMGSVYPPGLAIGKIVSVKSDEGNLMKTAQVKPLVDFEALETVYVIP